MPYRTPHIAQSNKVNIPLLISLRMLASEFDFVSGQAGALIRLIGIVSLLIHPYILADSVVVNSKCGKETVAQAVGSY